MEMNRKKVISVIGFSLVFVLFFTAMLFFFSGSNVNAADVINTDVESYDFELGLNVSDDNLDNDDAVSIDTTATNNTSEQIGFVDYENDYGNFSFIASKKGKLQKYDFTDPNAGFLIKGTAEFSKYEIKFDGFFFVYKKSGKVILYKGDMTLPNGDTYTGSFYLGSHQNSYKNGTYTWKTGESYKGKFSSIKVLNSQNKYVWKSCLGSDTTADATKAYYYFGSGKTEYVYIAFVAGKPYSSGTYRVKGNKYTVMYDSDGKCYYISA